MSTVSKTSYGISLHCSHITGHKSKVNKCIKSSFWDNLPSQLHDLHCCKTMPFWTQWAIETIFAGNQLQGYDKQIGSNQIKIKKS